MDMDLAIMNKGIRCGNREVHGTDGRFYHPTAADVRDCYTEAAREADDEALMEGVRQAEMGYERYLEDRGYEAARAQEEYEARMGINDPQGW